MSDPGVHALLLAGAGLVLALIVLRVWRARREAVYAAQRRRELRETRGYLYMQQQEIERLAARIVATSSTSSVAGFTVVRQVEALFTDGHNSTARAVQVLKAIAAEKGANAVLNLSSERLPSGKCAARGDAVIVRPGSDAGAAGG
jgi:uracil phosphoribosyltransferase